MAEKEDTAGAVAGYLNDKPAQLGAQARFSMVNAVGGNADFEAELRGVAQRTGVPVDTVRAYPDEMKKQATLGAYDFDSMAAEFPNTTRFLADQDKAAVAHDDTDTLKSVEQGFGSLLKWAMGNGDNQGFIGAGKAAPYVMAGAYAGVKRAAVDLVEPFASVAAGPDNLFSRSSTLYGQQAADFSAQAKAVNPAGSGIVAGGLDSGGNSLMQNAKYLPLALLGPAGAGVALAGMAGETFGQSYNKAADKGIPLGTRVLYAAADGVIEWGTEKGPLGALVHGVKMGAPMMQTIIKNAWQENKGEQVATLLQDLNEWGVLNPDKPFSDYIKERPAAAAQTLIATLVGAGGNVAIAESAQGAVDLVTGRQRKAEFQARRAEQSAQVFEALQKTAESSKLLERSPDTLRSYMQSLADEGASNVFVDSSKLLEAGVDLQALAQLVPSVASQLEQVQTGGDLVIPTGELLTNTIGSEFAQSLIENARTSEDGMSRAEAKVYMQEQGDQLNAEIDRVMAERDNDAEFKAGRDAVQGQILTQLNEVKRFTSKVNEQYAGLAANFYAVMAARTGMSVTQFADTYKLGFTGNNAAGGQVLDQSSPAFTAWFGDSKVTTQDGKALVVYHGTVDDFTSFDREQGGKNVKTAASKTGLFFIDRPDIAETYSKMRPGASKILPVYLSMQNPTRASFSNMMEADKFLAAGFEGDGAILEITTPAGRKSTVYAVKDAAQIKSSIGNNGQFDPTNSNILYQGNPADLVAQHNLTAENLLHAVKMGGIPVPSLAVTKKDSPLVNFGEITLLAPSEMIDPKGYAATQVFGADIYSPRYPQVTYELTPTKLKPLKAEFEKGETESGKRIEWDEVQSRGPAELKNSPAVMWQFLTEQGVTPDVKVKPAFDAKRRERLAQFGFEKFFGNTDHQQLMRDEDFQRVVVAEQNDAYAQSEMPDLVVDFESLKASEPSRLMNMARNPAYEMGKVLKTAEPDGYATRDALRAQIRGSLDEAFNNYVDSKFSGLGAKEKIFQGFSNSGDRRYTPHTLENVVKILKKELRGGENFNYGVGSLRAKFTPQFKSIEQIRKAKGRLMDKAGFEAVKEEVDNEMVALSDTLGLSLDQTIEVMEDAPKMGAGRAIERALKDYKQSNAEASDDAKVLVAEFLTKLRNLPTEYFEAKILRDVDLAEFKGAVVPEGVDPRVIKALNDHGVTDIRTYKKGDDADRVAKIGEFGNLFFQDARGQIAFGDDITRQASVISLLKGADLSTFIHESGHFFLEVQADLAARIEARLAQGEALSEGERSIVADMNQVLSWMGVQGTPERSAIGEWLALPLEEKRPYHEQFARGFEAYAFEGKAPSLDLQKTFQTFRAWLVNVYRSLLKSVNASKTDVGDALKVELSPEVRSVMDRMLATSNQIAEAEAARSMGPLFATAEQAGMSMDEFKAYHDQGMQSTMDAVDELQSRGLRDMQWLQNARSRKLKELQKQHDALRRETMMAVRSEVMSEDVYRAWTFLTAKGGDRVTGDKPKGRSATLDREVDNLFEAIAKLGGLDRASVKALFGIDEKEKLESGVFGQPVVRKSGGLSVEAMAERLMEEGYLRPGQADQTDTEQLEGLFEDQRRGVDRYSVHHDMQAAYGDAPLNVPELPAVGAGKLRTQDLRDAYGTQDDAVWRKLSALRMTSDETGLHPDIVAEMFGFDSGDELVQRLATVEPPKPLIESLTDERMLQEHGDLATPAGIERAADQAIHNDARARFVATELKALQNAMRVRQQVPGQRNTVDVLAQAAKEYAASVIARLKVRDIRPGQYAAAEVRAAKAAVKAGSDLEQASLHKRNQLINLYATKAAYAAQEEVKAMQAYFKGFDKRSKSIDAGYLDQIEQMLERYEFRQISLKAIDRRKSFAQWYAEQEETGNPPDVPSNLMQDAARKSYKDATIEELRGLRDTIKQIEHQGRLKNKLLLARDQREFDAVATDVAASIISHGGKARPLNLEGPNPVTDWFAGMAASHRKLSSLFREMDGNQDAGLMYQTIGRAMNERGTMEDVMVERATEALRTIYAPMLKLRGGITGYRSKLFIPEINASLTRGGRLSVALNWGNEANRQRIMDGDKWSDAQVKAILKTLTPQELAFVNQVWSYLDSFWPEIAAKEKRLTGVVPEKVEALPFDAVASDGSTVAMRGGYYPLKYDTDRSDRADTQEAVQAAKEMMQGVLTRATTRRGHTKERVKEVQRAVRKDLNVITQHVTQVTHDLAWHEWLIDTNKLLKDERIVSAIRDHYGPPVLKTMRDGVLGIAAADTVAQDAMGKALLLLRSNVTRATMGASLTTAFLQPFGLTQSMVRIGPQHVLRGMARWGGDAARMENTVEWIRGKSQFMRLRAKTFNKELREIRGSVAGQSNAMRVIDAGLFAVMQKMQLVADVPTWVGQYEKSIAQGLDEDAAVAMADRAVLESQGGGSTKDLSEVQRKHPMLTQFYSYFSVTLNLTAESTAATNFKNPRAVAGWLGDMALLLIIPAILPSMLMYALKGGGDDDEKAWAKRIAQWQLGYLMGMVVGVRELSGAVSGFDYAGPPVGRIVADLGKAGKQTDQGEMDEPAVMAYIKLMGTAFGIPVVQALRSYKGWKAWDEGQPGAGPQSALFGPPDKN